MRITIFPMGSRGDVQPYVALGIGLKRAGYDVTIPTSAMFRPLITEAGLEFREMDTPSPQEFMRDPKIQKAVREGGQVGMMLALLRHVAPMMEQLFESMWQHSHDADVIMATTFPFGAADVAEKRRIPLIWSPLHPMHPTRAFPNPFMMMGQVRFNQSLNLLSHHLARQFLWQMFRSALNKWRRKRLNLSPLPFFNPYGQIDTKPVPVVHAFSEHILPRPADWPASRHITGWWFLDQPDGWQPPDELQRFLDAGSPPVYIGFGSMADQRPERVVEIVIKALAISGQRGLLQSGWMQMHQADLPQYVMHIDPLPHSWLFPRVAAVVHHGGAGTTAAGIRAGIPSIITPVGGDQPFWAQRVQQLGIGLSPATFHKVTAQSLANAITSSVEDADLRQRAAALGARVRSEDGVGCAVGLIEQILA